MAEILRATASVERFPIAGSFVISRGARTEAAVVVATVRDGGYEGRAECVPYPRYGEAIDDVVAAIETADLSGGRRGLLAAMTAGAARNALDCALWDLEAKRAGEPVWKLAGLPAPRPVTTAFTISLGDAESMAEAARRADRPLLKLKLGGVGDPVRLQAVREAVPQARLIVDANEAWTGSEFEDNTRACAEARVELVEQPLPAGDDDLLDGPRDVPVCADESVHTSADLEALVGRYDAVNVKLDKTGGLTEALETVRMARRLGFRVMLGCMVGTSLSMAPALLLAGEADFVDLDGPLLLSRDRQPGLLYRGAIIEPADPALWG